MTTFVEGEKVQLIDEPGVVGTVDIVREFNDPDTDIPLSSPSYTIAWENGDYSEHNESELVALSEG